MDRGQVKQDSGSQCWTLSSSELASNITGDESAENATVLRLNTTTLGVHTLRVTNTGVNPIRVNLVLVYDTDLEGDSIVDSNEFWHNAFDVDSDGDGVSNGEEMILGLDRFGADTDHDGMNDAWEIKYGLNPLVNDTRQDPTRTGSQTSLNSIWVQIPRTTTRTRMECLMGGRPTTTSMHSLTIQEKTPTVMG